MRRRHFIAQVLLTLFVIGNGLSVVESCDCERSSDSAPISAEMHACACVCHLQVLTHSASATEVAMLDASVSIPSATDRIADKRFFSRVFHPPEILS
jgi:hypothetical protein